MDTPSTPTRPKQIRFRPSSVALAIASATKGQRDPRTVERVLRGLPVRPAAAADISATAQALGVDLPPIVNTQEGAPPAA